jgi:UDP-N-acetylmuramate-alanine ligase
MPSISDDFIKHGFGDDNINIIRSLSDLKKILNLNIQPNTVFLFMSSGNFGGLNYSEFTKRIAHYLPK